MQKENPSGITILGAGLVGSLLAIGLQKEGHQVSVFEKRHDPRTSEVKEGRSINLALSERGLRTLEKVGLREAALAISLPMKGRMVHSHEGKLNFMPYGNSDQEIYSISRDALNRLLISKAIDAGANINFECKSSAINFHENTFHAEGKNVNSPQSFKYLFGADGAFSAMRLSMQFTERFDYSQKYLNYGYKELSIPSKYGQHQMDTKALHIWPREDFMLIALPNTDGSFTCTLFLPFEGKNSFSEISSSASLHSFFEKHFPDAVPLMPDLNAEYFAKDASSMIMVKCRPWSVSSNSMLIGDAAHAIVPFYGQGMNAGFEDVRLLLEAYEETGNLSESISRISSTRKVETDAIGEMALKNFIEMRDLVGDPQFVLRKKIESRIIEEFPSYQTMYSLVTFSREPYSFALRQGQIQDKMFEEIFKIPSIENITEAWDSIMEVVQKYYAKSV